MENEQNEIKELIATVKAEKQAAKDKEARDSWTKFVSLTLVCLAVLTAIATLKGGGFTTRTLKALNEATFQQTLASDEWNLYQAKSIKQKLYEFQLETLGNAADPAVATALATALAGQAGEKPVALDVPEPNGSAVALAQAMGLTPVFETARMYTGPDPEIDRAGLYGITTFELG